MEDDGRVHRQVIGKRGGRFEEQRQVVLDAAGNDAVRNVLVQVGLRRIAFEELAVAAAKARAARIVERKFARGQQANRRYGIERALRIDVEGLDALDFVIEEVDPIGQRRTHREEIDQAAAHAEFSGRDDLRHVRIAGQRELRAQALDVEPLALLQKEREGREIRWRRQPVQRRRGGDDHHVAFAARDAVQRCQSLGDQVLVRREVVVGQCFPVREECHAQLGREPRNFLAQPLRGMRISGHHDRDAPGCDAIASKLRQRERVGGTYKGSGSGLAARFGNDGKQCGQRGFNRVGRRGLRLQWRVGSVQGRDYTGA